MTPQEKAKELCDAFYQKLPLEMYVTTTDRDLSWEYNSWKNSKECALIAVYELIEHTDWTEVNYWQEVKQEIEKL